MERNPLHAQIDSDIYYCDTQWTSFSYDTESMEKLQHRLLSCYQDVIDQFAQGLKTVSAYESSGKRAETYRENVTVLLQRMKRYQSQGYQNKEKKWWDSLSAKEYLDQVRQACNQARYDVSTNQGLSSSEKKSIEKKLEELEDIMTFQEERHCKWEAIRPYLIWISGKSEDVFLAILPVLLKIKEIPSSMDGGV